MAAIPGKPGIGDAGEKAGGLAADIQKKYRNDPKPQEVKENPTMLREKLKQEGGPGRSPDSRLQDKLGGALGKESAVARFHTGPAAAQAAKDLQASAFTIGQDVFFGANKFDPTTHKGLGLIAHETTHVLQQSGIKGDATRFFTQRGGDEMEQEAQDTAALVLRNLSAGESLRVREYVRNYSTEAGEAVTPGDRARLDEISLKALGYAQRELRRLGVRSIPSTRELIVGVELDLGEVTDEQAVLAWGEAIVDGIVALKAPVQEVPKVIQREPDPAPPNDKETLELSISSLAPYYADTVFTMSHNADAMYQAMMQLNEFQPGGKGTIRVLRAIIQDYLDINSFDKSKQTYKTSHLQFVINKRRDGDAAAFDRMARDFRAAGQKAKSDTETFLASYIKQGSEAFLKLTAASRKQVGLKLQEYGFSSNPELITDPANYVFAGGNDMSRKIADEAKKLLPLVKRYEQDKEALEGQSSWWHKATTTNAALEAEAIMAKDLPQATADWNRALAEASAKYPILSQYQTMDQIEELATSGAPEKLILKQLVDILVNLDTLDDKAKSDPGKVVFDIPKFRQQAETMFSEPWKKSYVEMTAEDRADSDAGWKTLLGAIGAALSLATGGASAIGTIVVEGALGAISVASLYSEIQDYRLQSAAAMSDMDKAKALSSEEPSLFWLAFDIVSTAVGLKGNVQAMTAAVTDVFRAYRVAQATGETSALRSLLVANSVPEATISKIVANAMGATAGVVNFIRNPDPMSALGLMSSFESFWGLRTAFFKSTEPPESVAKAKVAVQDQRAKILQDVVNGIKTKYPLVKVEVTDQGFEKPLMIVVGSMEVPLTRPAGPPSAGGDHTTQIPPTHIPTLIGLGPETPGKPIAKPPDGGYNYGKATKLGLGPGHDPALAKTQPQGDPTQPAGNQGQGGGGTPPPGGPPAPGGPPSSGTPSSGDPGGAKTQLAGDKTAPASPTDQQIAQAIELLRQAPQPGAGGAAATTGDWNILDAHTAADRADKVTPSPAPKGSPLGTPDQQLAGGMGAVRSRVKGVPEYYGIYFNLTSERFVVDDAASKSIGEGVSFKCVLRDKESGQLFIFKPATNDPALMPFYQVDAGTYMVRSRVATELSRSLPTIEENVVPVAIVVHDGRVGSLQPFKPGTKSLAKLRTEMPDVYQKMMTQSPGFQKFRDNLRVFDHIINNADRDTNEGNIMVELDKDNNVVKYYAIDQDVSLSPGAKVVNPNYPEETLMPRTDLSQSWTDPSHPVLGKISRGLYNEMVMMLANEASVRESWKQAFALNDQALDGVFSRLREVVRDYTDRLTKSTSAEVFNDN